MVSLERVLVFGDNYMYTRLSLTLFCFTFAFAPPEYLYLNHNDFTGEIPEDLFKIKTLGKQRVSVHCRLEQLLDLIPCSIVNNLGVKLNHSFDSSYEMHSGCSDGIQ